ncbi:MAG: trimethylamine methyltransferase family protein [candidate division WOR-3 bacterium]|nr:MAG: trimethylamine methyltransferase family protein [candidate division WOR-3 bacterium]
MGKTDRRYCVRPTVRFLDDKLIKKIITEARDVLKKLGVEIHSDEVVSMLQEHGAHVDKKHVFLNEEIIDKALKTAASSFRLYDVLGNETHHFIDDQVYFTPGSAALNILDHKTNRIRKPSTRDYIRYAKLVSRLQHIASQSTAFIPADVHERISDSYRLFLSLLYCEKPVVTGAFTMEAFTIMKNLQVAVRGTEKALAEKPLTIFSCCPTSPLKWSDVTVQNVIDCSDFNIPVEFVSMPLSGFMAPVTIIGTLVQHTAETLSGIVISQLRKPGTPMLYGGSPAAFDVRYETTPMGAIETQMIDCAYNEIGKYLGMPTQAYISLSDAKMLDAQAGFESAMGATLAGLSGINSISGPGMLDFESCQSLEKLVLDNEICGMVLRLVRGAKPKDDFPSVPHFEELLKERHLLISEHTRKFLRDEIYFPGPVVDRANRTRWEAEGASTLSQRAHDEVERLIGEYEESRLPDTIKKELVTLMESEAKEYGMDRLPDRF